MTANVFNVKQTLESYLEADSSYRATEREYQRCKKNMDAAEAVRDTTKKSFLSTFADHAGQTPVDLAIQMVQENDPERAVNFKMFWGGEQ